MPRQPKFIHPVRHIRMCAKLTQPNFARAVGMSASSLQAIELGKRGAKYGIDPRVAVRISARFGVKSGTFERRGLVPLDLTEAPYSSDSPGRALALSAREKSTGRELYRRKQILVFVDLLLLAASRANRFEACRWALVSWAVGALVDFDLKKHHEKAYRSAETVDWALAVQCRKRTAELRKKIESMKGPSEKIETVKVSGGIVGEWEAQLARLELEYTTSYFCTEDYKQMFRSTLNRRGFKFRWPD